MKKFIILLLFTHSILFSISQTVELIGYYNINGTMAIASIPDYMIISSGDIVDISDPSNPQLISNYSGGYGNSIIAEENFVYFGTEMTCDLYIADISNINFPLHQGFLDFGSDIGHGVFGMAKNDSILFTAIGASVCSIDITDKTNPTILDTLFIPNGQSRDVCIKDSYAFVAHYNGLKVVDISDPSNMHIISSIGVGYYSIDIDQTRVYVGKGGGGFDVFDISDPFSPIPLFSKANSGGTCWDIVEKDNLIYLAADGGFYIYKIENNDAQEMANYISNGGQNFSVCLQDSLILLSELVTGVAILQYDSTGTVGVRSDQITPDDISIFPNPAKDFINIRSEVSFSEVLVKIFNSQGVLKDEFIFSGEYNKHNISDYSSGIFICEFNIDGMTIGQSKLVVY